jgi:hypothetical protein
MTHNKEATLIFQYDVHEGLSFWNIKQYMLIFFWFGLISFVCKKTVFREFSPAARGNGGEQLSPISLIKS